MLAHATWAFALGLLSAVSLPLGSWVGLRFRFSPTQSGLLAAFGAGALLAALSVELVAPTSLALLEGTADPGGQAAAAFYAMIGGSVLGGLAYVGLNTAVNRQGGFRRKRSTLISHFRRLDRGRQREVLERVRAIPVFDGFPAEELETLLSVVEPRTFADGDVVLRAGDPVEAVYVVLEGHLDVTLGGDRIADVPSASGVVGVIAMLAGQRAAGTYRARGSVKALRIGRGGFERLAAVHPPFDEACRAGAAGQLDRYAELVTRQADEALEFIRNARSSMLERTAFPELGPSTTAEQRHGAPLSVWLGILLDGIPESLVIGAGVYGLLQARELAGATATFTDVIPFTLIAGLFLSNFPEALSSSANMLAQGWKRRRILFMWFVLMVVTGVGALLGYLLAAQLGPVWLTFFEGLAAGAMLTMIAAAMIPEAALMASGNAVGLCTLLGFLAAVLFKLLE